MDRRVPGFVHSRDSNGCIVVSHRGRQARVRAVRHSTNGNRTGYTAPGQGWTYGEFSVKGALRRARRALAAV